MCYFPLVYEIDVQAVQYLLLMVKGCSFLEYQLKFLDFFF